MTTFTVLARLVMSAEPLDVAKISREIREALEEVTGRHDEVVVDILEPRP